MTRWHTCCSRVVLVRRVASNLKPWTATLALMSLEAFGMPAKPEGSVVIDTFTECISPQYKVPCKWYPTQKDVSMFSIEEESGNHYVHIGTQGGNTTIGTKAGYRLSEFPRLSWRWRAKILPTDAREDNRKKADSGAAVYVIFRGRFRLNRMIKYVWSTTLPVGTVTSSPYNSRAKVIVVQSGSERLGSWLLEEVDVAGDYRRLFGDDPPPVEAIAFMSDADNTRSRASADYDDFRICR